MRICFSREATEEMHTLRALDPDLSEAIEACIGMLAIDANEFEGHEGFSIKRVGGLFRRGIRVYRVKYEKYIAGFRILFFSVASKDCVFVSGIHRRGDLGTGNDYDFARDPFARVQRYWGMKERLC